AGSRQDTEIPARGIIDTAVGVGYEVDLAAGRGRACQPSRTVVVPKTQNQLGLVDAVLLVEQVTEIARRRVKVLGGRKSGHHGHNNTSENAFPYALHNSILLGPRVATPDRKSVSRQHVCRRPAYPGRSVTVDELPIATFPPQIWR